MDGEMERIVRRILGDIRVELSEEFDRNFSRQAFFSKAWARRRSPLRSGGAILIDTGSLRRSVGISSDDRSVTFRSDLPYAGIHNEGGEIAVTARMKRYFWYRHMAAAGLSGRGRGGGRRPGRRKARPSAEAEFWKRMALMKVGARIRMPRRRFIGESPEVDEAVKGIIEENLTEYFNKEIKL